MLAMHISLTPVPGNRLYAHSVFGRRSAIL
jgi:hypothetical protein